MVGTCNGIKFKWFKGRPESRARAAWMVPSPPVGLWLPTNHLRQQAVRGSTTLRPA